MTLRANERVVYFNGEIMPESKVTISFRDRSFRYGDGAFDTTRTFGHQIFKLKPHIDRFFKTLKYLDLDPGLTPGQLMSITEDILERNLHLLDQGDDYWVTQRVSRGVEAPGGDVHEAGGTVVIVECSPLPFKARASYFRDGIEVGVPSIRRAAPDSINPRAKTHNYLNLLLGHQEIRRYNPKGWAILLDHNGNLCEGVGSNLFVVEDGVIATPQDLFVLCGISRETVIELAKQKGMRVVKRDIDLYDAYNADEMFITSTSFCICPVKSINGTIIGSGEIPGPITTKIIEAYKELVDYDFVAQYLRYLD